MQRSRIFLFLFFLFSWMTAFAQTPAHWSLSTDPQRSTLKSGENLSARLKAEIENGWHLYALEQPEGGPIATTIKVTEGAPFAIDGKIASPKPIVRNDPLFAGMDGKALVTKFFADTVTFSIPIKATAETTGGALSLDVRFQLCNDTFCIPSKP